MVGNDLAFNFLDAEYRLWNFDLEVLFNLDLATESPVVLDLLSVEESCFGREDISATLENSDFALSAVCFTAAGRRKENLLFSECSHEGVARSHVEDFVSSVDVDLDCTARGKFCLYPEQQDYQNKRNYCDSCCRGYNCKSNFIHFSSLLLK